MRPLSPTLPCRGSPLGSTVARMSGAAVAFSSGLQGADRLSAPCVQCPSPTLGGYAAPTEIVKHRVGCVDEPQPDPAAFAHEEAAGVGLADQR